VLEQVLGVHLRQLIKYLDAVTAGNEQQNMGYGHRGAAQLRMRGTPLRTGGSQSLESRGMSPNSPIALVLSSKLMPQFFGSGTNFGVHVVLPPQLAWFTTADSVGDLVIPGIPGGGGPSKFYAQVVFSDSGLGGFVGVTNAIEVRFER